MNRGRERALILAPLLLWVAAAIVLSPGPWDPLADPWFIASVPFYVAATVLLIKAPGNSIGWMMMGYPTTTAVAILGTAIATKAGAATSLAAWADSIGNAFATASIMFLPLLFLHFPDGLLTLPPLEVRSPSHLGRHSRRLSRRSPQRGLGRGPRGRKSR
jgi:hypothetical protein